MRSTSDAPHCRRAEQPGLPAREAAAVGEGEMLAGGRVCEQQEVSAGGGSWDVSESEGGESGGGGGFSGANTFGFRFGSGRACRSGCGRHGRGFGHGAFIRGGCVKGYARGVR